MFPKMRYVTVASNIDPEYWKKHTCHSYIVEVDTTGDGSFGCCERYSIEELWNPSHPFGHAYMHFVVSTCVISFASAVLTVFTAVAFLNIYKWINTVESTYGWRSLGCIAIDLIAIGCIVRIKKHNTPKD